MKRVKKFFKFFTSTVFISLAIGIILIIIGTSDFLVYLLPNLVSNTSPVHAIVRTIGAAFIGSGVFTAIIKSSEYSEIFSNVIGEIIWSKKYLEKRTDKKEIWSMISRLTYDEKFPLISEQIEDIITNHYFPVKHNYYVENYDLCLNVINHPSNTDYWIHEEVISCIVKPINANEKIFYGFMSSIDLPESNTDENPDLTSFKLSSIVVNGIDVEIPALKTIQTPGQLTHEAAIPLQHESEYSLVIKREKILSKRKNPDKRIFAPFIIKDVKATVILDVGMNLDFHKMGTIHEFKKSEEHINGGVKVVSWTYHGLILPAQGFIIIFK
ncbi:MAG TPA: hypothetical protein VF476_16700 [Chitinophagaceae bacterium]